MLAVEARYIVPETFQKESSLDRFFNRLMGRALKLGFAPGYMRLLEVRGRKSGKTFTTPVNVLDFNGRRWLVAPAARPHGLAMRARQATSSCAAAPPRNP